MTRNSVGWTALLLFILTIPAANWMIGHVGARCIPNGPCVIPVGFGLMAPSGVLMIGAALVLRDVVHDRLGVRWATMAIGIGAGASAFLAPAALAIASGAAFLISETADLLVYQPLYRRRLILAVALSSLIGAAVDSAAFLLIAFGGLDFLAGQTLGKAWMVLTALPLIAWIQRCRAIRRAAE